MTDISISDIDRISHKELDRKIEQLSFYINRVAQRVSAINNFMTPLKKEKIDAFNQKLEKKVHQKHHVRVKK